MGIFDVLETLSPWWWVAFGVALGAIEMLSFSLFLIWPALAALVMAAVLALLPGMPGEVQVAAFAALSLALTFIGRAMVHRYGDGGASPRRAFNRRSEQMVGRSGKVVRFVDGQGTVEIDGIPWRATSDAAPEPGDRVKVTGADGTILKVEPA